jgi:diguanylate cyclase (GGDEF)-like protein
MPTIRQLQTTGCALIGLTPGPPTTPRSTPRATPWVSPARGKSEFLRLRSVVDALVRIAEHAGDTASFLDQATRTVMELTRATGAVVLMAGEDGALSIASARGQMAGIDGAAFERGQTLARACLRQHQPLHSDIAFEDPRIDGTARSRWQLHSLIATPLRFGDEVLGVLEVCSSVSRAFDELDAQAVALIGNALGGALGRQMALDDNARLLAKLESALKATSAKAREYQDAALYDALTGLPNRAHFLARLEEVCAAHEGTSGGFAVLFLDLDDFKSINDTHGHAIGDAVLVEAAATLTACLREADLVARLGGDEFVVLVTSLRNGERDVEAIAANIIAALRRSRRVKQVELGIGASVGWVAHDGHSDAAAILAAADAAMYQHKKSRRPA